MIDVPNSSFPFDSLRIAKRPKGEHLYRVFSIQNRSPLTLFHFSQLVAWTAIEFDSRVVSYEVVNRWFDGKDSSLFIAFYVRLPEHDHFFYISNVEHPDTTKAFEKYSNGMNVSATALAKPVQADKSIEFWNRLKMLCVISQHQEKMTQGNLDKFLESSFSTDMTIGELVDLPKYTDGEAVAYAFELIRQGICAISNPASELINLSSTIRKNKPGRR